MSYRIIEKMNPNGNTFNVQESVGDEWLDVGLSYMNKMSAQDSLNKLLTEENKNIKIHESNGTVRGQVQSLFD